jgi:hypothetical protein
MYECTDEFLRYIKECHVHCYDEGGPPVPVVPRIQPKVVIVAELQHRAREGHVTKSQTRLFSIVIGYAFNVCNLMCVRVCVCENRINDLVSVCIHIHECNEKVQKELRKREHEFNKTRTISKQLYPRDDNTSVYILFFPFIPLNMFLHQYPQHPTFFFLLSSH